MNVFTYINNLVKYEGAPYVYGAKQTKNFDRLHSKEDIQKLQSMYGRGMVWDSDLGKRGMTCCDCSGFVDFQFQKGYNSSMLFDNSTDCRYIRKKNGKISKKILKQIPLGAVLYQKGHVGVFIGWVDKTPYYIAEDGSRFNCRINKVSDSGFNWACWGMYNDLKLYRPKQFKVVRNCKAYTTADERRVKRTFKKGKKIHAVMKVNNHVLCRNYSRNRDCWVSVRDLVEIIK